MTTNEGFPPSFGVRTAISRASAANKELNRFQSRGPGGPEITSYTAVTIASRLSTSFGFAGGRSAALLAAAADDAAFAPPGAASFLSCARPKLAYPTTASTTGNTTAI